MKNYPMFVYGTLRPGGQLHPMIHNVMVRRPAPASIGGFQLYANPSKTYPYMTAGLMDDEVQGDILIVEEGKEFHDVVNMEVGAGYDLVIVPAVLSDGSIIDAIAFVLPQECYAWLGTRIRSGDWLKFEDGIYRGHLRHEARLISQQGYVEKIPAARLAMTT